MHDILVMGSNTVDCHIDTEAELIRIEYPKSHPGAKEETILGYPMGHKVLAKHVEFQIGGSGINAATAFQKAELNTAYIGCIGKDHNGHKVFQHLKDHEITFHGSLGAQNGFSVILDSQAEDRTILTHKGCNNDLAYKDVDLDEVQGKWFYSSTVMGKTLETLKKLLPKLKKKGVKTALNTSYYLAKQGAKKLKPLLNHADVLIINKDEARLLSGEMGMENALNALHKHVGDAVVVTDGANGAYIKRKKSFYRGHPKKNVDVVETTGAGDAFAAGYLTAQIHGHNTKESMKLAFLQAESVISTKGATKGMLTYEELKKKLGRDKRKIRRTLSL